MTIVLEGETLAESEQSARALGEREGLAFVHPYDDPHIIAGQGTVAIEMLRDAPDLDVIVAPLGGGGLISGIAIAAKAIRPEAEIIGVEAATYPSMTAALAGRKPTFGGATVAEGIAVKVPGKLTRPIVEQLVADVIVLNEDALERAIEALARQGHIVAEEAGAATLGAVLQMPERFRNRRVGLVISGGNIDPRLLASVLLRGLVRDGQLIRLRVLITDSPGTLALATALASTQEADSKYYGCLKAGILAYLQGYAPAVAVEFARKALLSSVRPTFIEVEQAVEAVPPA